MSVSLTPSSALGFNRPLTVLVKRTLTVTNNNAQPVAFKVKTTAPKLYCVRPNSGRIEPGESVDVSVMLQPMKEEPPISAKCKDKFLIQSTLITSDKETLPLHDIWNVPEGGEEAKVHQQKLRVVYLPPEGQVLVEDPEEEPAPLAPPTVLNNSASEPRDDTVQPLANGHPEHPITDLSREPEPEQEPEQIEDNSRGIAPADIFESAFIAAPEAPAPIAEPTREISARPITPAPLPPAPAPAPEPIPVPVAVVAPAEPAGPDPAYLANVNADLQAKYREATLQIERLQALLAAAPEPTSLAPSEIPSGVRRRGYALSDDGTSTFDDSATYDDRTTAYGDDRTDAGTVLTESSTHTEGVPLQVVLIISIGVFITTYLFF
ncbi:hypothetical protein HWV62_30543 [Athelia sp. TMB]|nr:hypothetical protein HWV62_30543 [Athelia sp. TMB]